MTEGVVRYRFRPGIGRDGLYMVRSEEDDVTIRAINVSAWKDVENHISPEVLDARAKWLEVENIPSSALVDLTTPEKNRSRETKIFLEWVKKELSKCKPTSFDTAKVVPAYGATKKAVPETREEVVEEVSERTEVTRPNGEQYVCRTINGVLDVDLLQRVVAGGLVPYLYGDPGCGKTALIEAAFGAGLETIIGDADTDSSAFFGSWVQIGESFEWIDGPLIRAMKNGTTLYIDEIGLIDARVISILNPLLDGRRHVDVPQNPLLGTVEAADGFQIVCSGNPNALGVRMSEALLSRLSFPLEVCTDYDLLRDRLGVPGWMVSVATDLVEAVSRGETAWAPQARELLSAAQVERLFDEEFAADALVAAAPAHSRDAAVLAIQGRLGYDAKALCL